MRHEVERQLALVGNVGAATRGSSGMRFDVRPPTGARLAAARTAGRRRASS